MYVQDAGGGVGGVMVCGVGGSEYVYVRMCVREVIYLGMRGVYVCKVEWPGVCGM